MRCKLVTGSTVQTVALLFTVNAPVAVAAQLVAQFAVMQRLLECTGSIVNGSVHILEQTFSLCTR